MTPDHSSRHGTTSLRPIGMPRILDVAVDAIGDPIAVTRTDLRGRQGPWLTVEAVEEQWCIAEAWWRPSVQERTYFRLRLDGGLLLTLFRDDVTGAWFDQPYSAPEETRR